MVVVALLHPDMGIGGAERLVVDAAVALKNGQHSVHIITTHHSKSHCFKETIDGTLIVTVVGDWLPRTIFGKCYAFCSYLRIIYAALYLIFFSNIVPDVVFCDQVSVCVPILHLKVKRVIFYCHFPDMLLCSQGNVLKRFYRIPINWLEEKTTGLADTILVNSKFTNDVFKDTFRSIQINPIILYPSINTAIFDIEPNESKGSSDKTTFVSINRYERKKNIALAIQSLAILKNKMNKDDWYQIELIIAGGHDELVPENIEYYQELVNLSYKLNVSHSIIFLKSPQDNTKIGLLKNCRSVIYTPVNEHFGIVPLEAMYCKKPVIAVNSGGPTETIVNNETGFLCAPQPEDFADAMYKCFSDLNLVNKFGEAAYQRFNELFSFDSFSNKLNNIIEDTLTKKHK